MDKKLQKKVYVIGHKNPDTDSICSAIAYANLKNKITGEKYVPKRAGEINGETAYVLEHFWGRDTISAGQCTSSGKRYGYPSY